MTTRSATHFGALSATSCLVQGNGDRSEGAALQQTVARIASALASRELPKPALVGILLPKGILAYETILGVLGAGYGYVAIDPSWPDARVSQVLDLCKPALVIVEDKAESSLPCDTVSAGSLRSTCDGRAGALPEPPSSRHDIAYVVCTSGTTGRPKAVAIGREAANAFSGSLLARYRYGPRTRWLSVAPLHFDASTVDIIVLGAGGTVHIGERVLLPADVMGPIDRYEITDTLLVSSLLRMICMSGSRIDEYSLRSLERLWYGGEACPKSVLQKMKSKVPHLRFIHGYGPSELCNTATFFDFEDVDGAGEDAMPIGTPLPTVTAHVLDDDLQLVDGAGEGELWLGGVQTMTGYLNDPSRTAEVLVEDFLNPESGFPLYRTGDFVGRRADGLLEFRGRKDDLVKTGGNLVSLMEVRSQIARSEPTLEEVFVIARPDELLGARIVAFLVRADRVSVRDLMRRLAERLPAYMLPREMHVLAPSEVPIGETGKADIERLRQTAISLAETSR